MSANIFKKTLFVALGIVLLITACSPATPTAAPSALTALLSDLQGKVDMRQTIEQTFIPAVADTTLDKNGQLQTGDNGKARLDLSTGTIVRVSPSSLFTLISNQETNNGLVTTLKLELGRIFIILKGGSMEVNTPSGVASVRGSYMMVEIDPVTLDVLITCLEGNCTASNQAGTVNFTGGQKTTLFAYDPATGQFTPPGVEPMNADDYQKWLDENPEAAAIINQASATLTAMAATAAPPTEPPATEPPATEPAPTEPPATETPTAQACFNLLHPENGSKFFTYGGVNFQWESQPGATKYVLTFTYPTGTIVNFETTDTNMTRYIESMPPGGEYTWDVTAYDENGNVICKAQSDVFTKAETPKVKPTNAHKPEKPPATPACNSYNCFCDCPPTQVPFP